MAMEKPRKLREFFSPTLCPPCTGVIGLDSFIALMLLNGDRKGIQSAKSAALMITKSLLL